MSDKDRQKWITDTTVAVQSFGNFRQPMAWGAIPAFSKKGKLELKEAFCEIPLWKMKPTLTDEALYELMNSADKVYTNFKLLCKFSHFLEFWKTS